tara:strand:- start:237 stop:626 length:390 start_codon:yes stop_codon:yes gene_type:complete
VRVRVRGGARVRVRGGARVSLEQAAVGGVRVRGRGRGSAHTVDVRPRRRAAVLGVRLQHVLAVDGQLLVGVERDEQVVDVRVYLRLLVAGAEGVAHLASVRGGVRVRVYILVGERSRTCRDTYYTLSVT